LNIQQNWIKLARRRHSATSTTSAPTFDILWEKAADRLGRQPASARSEPGCVPFRRYRRSFKKKKEEVVSGFWLILESVKEIPHIRRNGLTRQGSSYRRRGLFRTNSSKKKYQHFTGVRNIAILSLAIPLVASNDFTKLSRAGIFLPNSWTLF
jgi:hypothetical protein